MVHDRGQHFLFIYNERTPRHHNRFVLSSPKSVQDYKIRHLQQFNLDKAFREARVYAMKSTTEAGTTLASSGRHHTLLKFNEQKQVSLYDRKAGPNLK